MARSYCLTPGEISDTAAEAKSIGRLRKGGLVSEEDIRQGIDRRLRNGLGDSHGV